MTPEKLAEQFHDIYERLAPAFGYETRPDTRHFNPDSPNGRLMIAVCDEVLADLDEKLKWHERLEELELEGMSAFLDGKSADSHGLTDAGEQAAWLAGYENQQELTALRAKLAAAESVIAAYNEWHFDLDETGCPTGGVHCPICSGGGHRDRRQNSPIRHKPDCPREAYNHVELLSVIPGTTVADALAELRAELERIPDDDQLFSATALRKALQRALDDVSTRLGLAKKGAIDPIKDLSLEPIADYDLVEKYIVVGFGITMPGEGKTLGHGLLDPVIVAQPFNTKAEAEVYAATVHKSWQSRIVKVFVYV